jgi:NifU-like protein involved in Fe-S cluster formation
MYLDPILHLWSHPYHRGIPEEASSAGAVVGQEGFPGEGPFMQLALAWEEDHCVKAWFETYSCPAAVACGSSLALWLEGKTSEQAASLTAEDLSHTLGGLPLGKTHCAQLAISALKSALVQMQEVVVQPADSVG